MNLKSMPRGVRIFSIVWLGQLVSTMGSALTGFALGVWIYQETGSTSLFALNMIAYAVPNLLVSPFAGALVDRWDRRWVMIMSDTGAGLSTLAITLLLFTGRLEIWHIFIATAVNAAFNTFQWPAYSATTTLLVPKAHLGRAAGLVQVGEAISQLGAPVIAGAMLVTTGLKGVVLVDFITFGVAVGTLLFVRFPKPEKTAEGQAGQGSLLREALYGWQYIIARQGLFGLLLVFAMTNFLYGMMNPLLAPLVLDMTTADRFGLLASIAGIGTLLGTLLVSTWGGPKRRVHGVLGYMILGGIFMAVMGLSPSLFLITSGAFMLFLTNPIVNASSQAIWQSKVAPDVQGRVFSVRRMIAWSTTPLAYALAGPLADRVFKPLLVEGGALAGTFGPVLGVGPGRGVGLFFIVLGFLSCLTALAGYLSPRVRLLEDELPDAIPDKGSGAQAFASTSPENQQEPMPSPAD